MQFGGIQKNSFIDFPGRIACILFVSGCNFTCPYCHNPDLARGRLINPLPEKEAYRFLEDRRGFLEGVVISGGEPTLIPEIFRICRTIKSLGFPIKLDTNGSRPEILDRLLREKLIDYVAMDVKTDPENYAPPLAPEETGPKVLASIERLKEGQVPYEFRTTCVAPFISPSIMIRIGYWLKGAQRYILQPFRPDTVLMPGFFKDASTSICDLKLLQSAVAPMVPICQVRS